MVAINQDFDAFRSNLAKTRAKARSGADVHDLSLEGGEEDEDLIAGSELPADVVSDTGGVGHGDGDGNGNGGSGDEPPTLGPEVVPDPTADNKRGSPTGGAGGRPRSSGGFSVEYRSSGSEAQRAFYDRSERTIFINLDHPQIAAAKGEERQESVSFRRLSYEVAFTEYSVALQRELVERGEYLDMDEPLQEVRSTLDRLSRRAAKLYAPG